MCFPALDFVARAGKAQMAGARSSMRRHRKPCARCRRLDGRRGIEEQENARAASKENVPSFDFHDPLQPHDAAIKRFRGVEVIDIEGGFENGGWLHWSYPM